MRRVKALVSPMPDDSMRKKMTGDLPHKLVIPRVCRGADECQFQRTVQQEIGGHQRLGKSARNATDLLSIRSDGPRGGLTEIIAILMKREPSQGHRRDGVAARRCPIRAFPPPQDERFVIVGRGKEAALLLVKKVRQQSFPQPDGLREISRLPAGFIQVDQSFDETGIILKVRLHVSLLRTIGSIESAVGTRERTDQKVRGPRRGFQIRCRAQHPGRFGHGTDHHAVPGRDDFVVQPGRHALEPRLIHERLHPINRPLHVLRRTVERLGHVVKRGGNVGNTVMLPIAVSRDVIIRTESSRVFLRGDHGPDLFRVPYEKFSFDPL